MYLFCPYLYALYVLGIKWMLMIRVPLVDKRWSALNCSTSCLASSVFLRPLLMVRILQVLVIVSYIIADTAASTSISALITLFCICNFCKSSYHHTRNI